MFLRLLLLFTLVPLVELWLLLRISDATTPLFTFALVIATGIVGAALARHQGWRTWMRIQQQLSAGRAPAAELVNGLMILIAGVLLVTPGVLTDCVGFCLLIPTVRRRLRQGLGNWLIARTMIRFHSFRQSSAGPDVDDQIIDVEFVRRPRHKDPEDRRNISEEEPGA